MLAGQVDNVLSGASGMTDHTEAHNIHHPLTQATRLDQIENHQNATRFERIFNLQQQLTLVEMMKRRDGRDEIEV